MYPIIRREHIQTLLCVSNYSALTYTDSLVRIQLYGVNIYRLSGVYPIILRENKQTLSCVSNYSA